VIDVIGGVAGGLAIVAAVLALLRWGRGVGVRQQLRLVLETLRDYDALLSRGVRAIESAFESGVGWRGWAIWPEGLAEHLNRLETIDDTLDELIAHLRAVDAHGSNERVRAVLEELAIDLQTAVATAIAGTIQFYRATEGEPTPRSATLRGYVFTVPPGGELAAEERQRHVALHFRTVSIQLDREIARADVAQWPVRERDLY
jgi:hypothetical protein